MNKIRNSATKKKVNKIFNEMTTREHDDVDSGIYSKQTSRDESEYSKEPTYSSKKGSVTLLASMCQHKAKTVIKRGQLSATMLHYYSLIVLSSFFLIEIIIAMPIVIHLARSPRE